MSRCSSSQSSALTNEVNRLRNSVRQLELKFSVFAGVVGLCPAPCDGMVDVVTAFHDPVTGITTLNWLSTPGAFYKVEQSTDMANWTIVTGGASIPANTNPAEPTAFETPVADPPIFYRVRKLPSICT